jgi:hypothetical protein
MENRSWEPKLNKTVNIDDNNDEILDEMQSNRHDTSFP